MSKWRKRAARKEKMKTKVAKRAKLRWRSRKTRYLLTPLMKKEARVSTVRVTPSRSTRSLRGVSGGRSSLMRWMTTCTM